MWSQLSDEAPQAIVFLAAGRTQAPHLETLAALPVHIIAVDQDRDAVGFRYADECIVSSTHDTEPLLEHLLHLRGRYRIRGVVSGSHGEATVTASRVAQALGLPSSPTAAVTTVNDKGRFLATCRDLGLPVPFHATADVATPVAWDTLPYPLVLKPSRTLVGKAAVVLARDPEEARRSFADVRERSAGGSVELEAYIEGHDVVLVGFVADDALTPIVLLDELNVFEPSGALRGGGMQVPSRYAGTPTERAVAQAGATLAQGLALTRSPFLLSLRIDAHGAPWIIELHLQLGGDYIFEGLLAASASHDVTQLVVAGALGLIDSLPGVTYRPMRTKRDAAGTWTTSTGM